jgi:hypothetical protein
MNHRSVLKVVVGAIIYLSATTISQSALVNGYKLADACKHEDTFCMGYIEGVSDSLLGDKIEGFKACILHTDPPEKIRKIVELWLKDHPSELYYSGAHAIAASLSEAYPCN